MNQIDPPAIERNVEDGREIVRRPDGLVVLRITMSNGTVQDTPVFPGDYPNPRQVGACCHPGTLTAYT